RSVPVLTFVSYLGGHFYECQNQGDTSNHIDSSVALTLTFLRRIRGGSERNVRVATLGRLTARMERQMIGLRFYAALLCTLASSTALAAELPRARPEEVGMSSERLA